MEFFTVIMQSNDVGGSTRMEKVGLERTFALLAERGFTIGEIVTDRHPQIQKWLKDNHPHITHFYDIWHVAKGVYNMSWHIQLQICY